MVHQLSSDDFEESIKSKKVHLIDVREPYEFKNGFIKGATLVPATRFDEGFEKLKVKKGDKIALYCSNGNRSDFIARKLSTRGYENIYNLEMGTTEWIDYGKKLVKK